MLLDLKARGMNVPKLAVGDGALGFWSALDEIYPTRHVGCTRGECVECASEVGTILKDICSMLKSLTIS